MLVVGNHQKRVAVIQILLCVNSYIVCLSYVGLDGRSAACQEFYKDGLTLSFTKILTDDAVNSWKYEIQVITKRLVNSNYITVVGLMGSST